MSLAVAAGIGLIGGLGAIARFLLDGAVAERVGGDFPYGTLAVNLLGTFVLGVLVGAALRRRLLPARGDRTHWRVHNLQHLAARGPPTGENGQRGLAFLNLAVSLVLGIAAAWAGRQIGTAL